jgi:hypothetical protein
MSPGVAGRALGGAVAIDPSGDSTVTWYDGNGIEAASRTSGTSFGPAQVLAGAEARLPTLADGSNLAGGNGDVLAAMPIEGGSGTRIVAALRPAGASFESPVTVEEVPAGSEPNEPKGAIDAAGDSAVLVWGYYDDGFGPGTIRAALTGGTPGGGEEHTPPPGSGSGTSKTMPGTGKAHAVRCKKGFKKKRVHGKTKCVKPQKKHRHKKH